MLVTNGKIIKRQTGSVIVYNKQQITTENWIQYNYITIWDGGSDGPIPNYCGCQIFVMLGNITK